MPTPRWATSHRRTQLPPNWPTLRQAARKRAEGQCQGPVDLKTGVRPEGTPRCANPGRDCDHIGDRDDHRLENLQWLCRDCHEVKTKNEAREALRAKQQRGKRKPVPHPGLRPQGDGGSPQGPPTAGLPA